MNYLQTELILLNLLRQSEEFVVSLLGLMPEPDAGSFYKRLSTLYEIFKTDKTGFAASSFRLGQVALFLKEYAALTKQNIDQVDIPEILSPAISWEDIEDKPEFFAPYTHFHKWEEIANKPIKYLPVTHQHTWNDVSDKPTTFPPSAHTHDAQAVAWNDVTDKPTTFPPEAHTHEAQAVAVAWSEVTDKPTTFTPAEHTHPEYEGGGGTASAISRQWALLLNKAELTYLNLPATLWTGATMRLTASGVLPAYEADERLMRITEIATGNDLLQVFRFATTLMLIISPGYSVSVPYSGTSFEMEIEVTPTNFRLTVNGDATASADGGRVYTEEALSWTLVNMQTWMRCGCWTGDPATTAPMILADAAHIDNNILINQAARHIGEGQYDLTLDAPVVIFQ